MSQEINRQRDSSKEHDHDSASQESIKPTDGKRTCDPNHVSLVKQGTLALHEWRKKNPLEILNLQNWMALISVRSFWMARESLQSFMAHVLVARASPHPILSRSALTMPASMELSIVRKI